MLLGLWAQLQRADKKRGRLPPDRVKAIDTLVARGLFSWDYMSPNTSSAAGLGDDWDMKFKALCTYIQEYGHSNVPDLYRAELDNGSSVLMNRWLARQKKLQMQGSLRADREAKVQDLVDEGKVAWDKRRYVLPDEPSWPTCVKVLEAYAAQHGTCNCRVDDVVRLKGKILFPLGLWLNVQRAAWRAKRLPADQEASLQAFVDAGQLSWQADAAAGGGGDDDDKDVAAAVLAAAAAGRGAVTTVDVDLSDSDSEADADDGEGVGYGEDAAAAAMAAAHARKRANPRAAQRGGMVVALLPPPSALLSLLLGTPTTAGGGGSDGTTHIDKRRRVAR